MLAYARRSNSGAPARHRGRPHHSGRLKSMAINIHPAVDGGVKPTAKDFSGGTLVCKCAQQPVTIKLSAQTAFNHVCGCTKCWKPKGALFAQVAVVSRDKLRISKNADKLKPVDASALIVRHACRESGVHRQGPVEREKHPFTGLDFIHTALSSEPGGP